MGNSDNGSRGAASGDTSDFVKDVYRELCFIRAFETAALELSQTKPPIIQGSIHLCAGQEVVPIAALAALHEDDQVICTYRGHGWALASKIDPTRAMAELCHRADGLNGGRGGSAHMMAPDTRFIGENSIVGAGTTIACGVALANLAHKNGKVVIVSIGDGAMNQGAVHEAFAFASVKRLPIIFVVENNGWSELTATEDMFCVDRLATRARGYGMQSATVSGTDPIAVRASVANAAEHARSGQGPVLLEFKVPRLWGHYNRDIEHYRSKADRAQAEAQDPLALLANQVANASEIQAKQTSRVTAIVDHVLSLPGANVGNAARHVVADLVASVVKESDRKVMTGIEAVNAALRAEIEADESVIFFGEDVGKAGGIFGGARNLQRDFGSDRVFDTPIAENAILGAAVGAAVAGLRPVVEIMWADFLFVAFDQLINQAANVRYVTEGRCSAPLVVRTQQGATPGSCAQHSQSIEAMLAHVPGLKVAVVANAQDNYAVLRAAIRDNDPCIVIESRATYQEKCEVVLSDVAEPVGKARLRRAGNDVAIVSWGTMVDRACVAAEALALEGINAAVLDLRWLSPIDYAVLDAVINECGGNALVVHEAVRTGGFGAEIAMQILERRTASQQPVNIARMATSDSRIPASPELQAALIPNATDIAAAVRRLIGKEIH